MNKTTARVFVSHSGWEAVVENLVGALERAFGDDFEALYDRSAIRGGDRLKAEIDRMIRECDAAIVVVDHRALEYATNRWVFSESSRLHDRPLQVIPLFVAGVSPEDIKTGWEATGLDDLLGYTDRDMTLDELAAQVVGALAPTLRRVRRGAVRRRIATMLDDYFGEVVLDDVASMSDAGDWRTGHVAHAVAEALIAPGAQDGCASYGAVMAILSRLAEVHLERAGEVLYVVIPFTWVNTEVAGQIPDVVGSGLFVGLGARQVETSKAYVHCSEAAWPPWCVHPVDPGSDSEFVEVGSDLDEQLQRIDARRAVPSPGGEEPIDLIAVVCHSAIDPGLLQIVRERVGERVGVHMVLLVGELEEDDVDPADRTRIKFLKPKVKQDDEQIGCRRLDEARTVLWNRANEDRKSRGRPTVPYPW